MFVQENKLSTTKKTKTQQEVKATNHYKKQNINTKWLEIQ